MNRPLGRLRRRSHDLAAGGYRAFSSAVVWLLRDEFTTAAGAPLASPRTAEPGPGQLTITDSANTLSINSSNEMVPSAAATGIRDPWVREAVGRSRVAGRMFYVRVKRTSAFGSLGTVNVGWANTLTTPDSAQMYGLQLQSASGVALAALDFGSFPSMQDLATDNTYSKYAIILFATGFAVFVDGKLAWIGPSGNEATLYPMIIDRTANGKPLTRDYFRVRDVPSPFTSALGIAQNNITSFTQSAGAELLTNGNFSAWTADNPDGWAVSGEVGSDPMVTQVQPNGSAGTGAARLFASTATTAPSVSQNIKSAGSWYECSINLSARVSGTMNFVDNVNLGGVSSATVGVHSAIFRAGGSTHQISAVSGAHDFTVDDASVKLLTLNAVATMDPNSIIDFLFTDPAAVAGRTVQLRFRLQDDQNYWTAYVKVNDAATNWDFNLDSVVAGTATNRLNVTNINGQDGIRIICDGNLIDCYTKNGSTWTKRGSQVNNSTLATATGLTTVYSTGTTPTQLINYQRSSSAYSVLDAA